jgi:RNA polymerase sigma factor (sigma-70 family)
VARPPLRLKGPEKQKLVDQANQPLTADQKAMVEAYAKAWPWPAAVIRRAYYKTYHTCKSLGLADDDMSQICWQGVFRAARTYDPAYKASFATYAAAKMRGILSHWVALQTAACRHPPNTLLPLDEKFAVPMAESDPDSLDDERVLLRQGLELLDPRVQEMMKLRYGLTGKEPMNLRELRDLFGLSRERIRQLTDKGVRQLKDFLT